MGLHAGDDPPFKKHLAGVGAVRAAMLGGAAVTTATGGAVAATYCFAVVATVAMTLYRPAHSALLPALAKSPRELASANAVRGMLDSSATLGGPVIAAVLLAASGPAAVFAVCAAASLAAGLVVVALPYDTPPRADAGRAPGRGASARRMTFSNDASMPGASIDGGTTSPSPGPLRSGCWPVSSS